MNLKTKKREAIVFPLLLALFAMMISSCANGTTEVAEEPEREPVIIERDKGKEPWVVDIEAATKDNDKYRLTIWTGEYMQAVLMSLKPGEVIDLELHADHDQFIRVEKGKARILMGPEKESLTFNEEVADDWAIFIPAGYWHKVENIGEGDLRLYTLYGPPEHAKGTTHATYEDTRDYEH